MFPQPRSAKSTPVSQSALSALFRPNSVAVIGTSPTSDVRRTPLEHYKRIGYSGTVAAVNPKYEEVAGYPCYPSLKGMPFVPDAVLILRNRDAIVAALEEAAEVGVRAAVIPEMGFAEAGADGAAAQARIADVARASGMAVLGPNSGGMINWADRVHLNMGAFEVHRPGHVALISQGGGTRLALLGTGRGVRWSHAIIAGNEAVTGSADILRYFVDDPNVRVICGFIEAVRDPERFFFECDRAHAAGKPVILLKPGRTEASQELATAHTGALAAPYRFYRELFKKHGVVRVDSLEELLASAMLAQTGRPVGEGRVGAVCPSGGLIQMYVDEMAKCEAVRYAEFQPETVKSIRSIIPPEIVCRNPLDAYWGYDGAEESSKKIYKAIATDRNVDVFTVLHFPNLNGPAGELEDTYAACAVEVAAATDKPVALLTPVDGSIPLTKANDLLDKNIIVLGQREAFRALDRAVKWARPLPPISEVPLIDRVRMAKQLHDLGDKPFSGRPALDFLAAAGIPVVESRFVTSVDAAISAANELGYPVVAKIGDTGVLHRTELSGVVTNIRDAKELSQAATKLFAAGSQVLIVQPFVRDGTEMILGLETDPVLGSFILVGQGGIWTEIMEDVALRPAGLRVGEPERMLDELRVQKILRGFRGAPALDVDALTGTLTRLDAIARSLGDQIRSIDINPLIVRKNGAVAVDALIVPASRRNE
ncbi:acetate--CoA ligase family protein [Bradyrhizobium centrolobii]|uniref:acetate--CoA ligase family protein n=1 Tax=Bradyrhizobium centrolobii TaxID=1505087 RepID=UPI000B102D6B|nr:acetate--CoA ligase family protein [Bradyrhizobium centrolobii]